eukprot:TRINITY_DN7177_c0_g2_i1.p1 TRINITY_DN7177_c0_g2~~TRINITY_DN7177_c0_g2_i1.p1  ORF type:complete len:107 (+),score=1.45 TRINITY_DN7177_c0_g2_i1:276-596(+)
MCRQIQHSRTSYEDQFSYDYMSRPYMSRQAYDQSIRLTLTKPPSTHATTHTLIFDTHSTFAHRLKHLSFDTYPSCVGSPIEHCRSGTLHLLAKIWTAFKISKIAPS